MEETNSLMHIEDTGRGTCSKEDIEEGASNEINNNITEARDITNLITNNGMKLYIKAMSETKRNYYHRINGKEGIHLNNRALGKGLSPSPARDSSMIVEAFLIKQHNFHRPNH